MRKKAEKEAVKAQVKADKANTKLAKADDPDAVKKEAKKEVKKIESPETDEEDGDEAEDDEPEESKTPKVNYDDAKKEKLPKLPSPVVQMQAQPLEPEDAPPTKVMPKVVSKPLDKKKLVDFQVRGDQGGIRLVCVSQNCPQSTQGGKMYYLLLNKDQAKQMEVEADQIFKSVIGGTNSEVALSGEVDLGQQAEYNIKRNIPDSEFMLYLATDSDGRGSNLQLISNGLDIPIGSETSVGSGNQRTPMTIWDHLDLIVIAMFCVTVLYGAAVAHKSNKNEWRHELLHDYEEESV